MNTHIYVYIYNINITNKYTYYLSIYILSHHPHPPTSNPHSRRSFFHNQLCVIPRTHI